MGKYRWKLKKRGGRHGRGADPRQHLDHRGRAKKRLSVNAAHALAERTGMNAYHCEVCGAWHVGRTAKQIEMDGPHGPRPHGGDEDEAVRALDPGVVPAEPDAQRPDEGGPEAEC